jgi:hypothetical protein
MDLFLGLDSALIARDHPAMGSSILQGYQSTHDQEQAVLGLNHNMANMLVAKAAVEHK